MGTFIKPFHEEQIKQKQKQDQYWLNYWHTYYNKRYAHDYAQYFIYAKTRFFNVVPSSEETSFYCDQTLIMTKAAMFVLWN